MIGRSPSYLLLYGLLVLGVQNAANAKSRRHLANGGDRDHDDKQARIAEDVKPARAHQPPDFGMGGGAAEIFGRDRQQEEHRGGGERPDDARPYPEHQEVQFELPRDEPLLRADEIEHLDDFAVRRHGAAGGGNDDRDGRHRHEAMIATPTARANR